MFRISAKGIVFFSTICFIGLVALQFIWIKSAYQGEKALLVKEKKQFESAVQNAFSGNIQSRQHLKDVLDNYEQSQKLIARDEDLIINNFQKAIDSVLSEKAFSFNIDNFGIVRHDHLSNGATRIHTVALLNKKPIRKKDFERAGKMCLHCVLKISEAEHQKYNFEFITIYSPEEKLIYNRLGPLTGISLLLLLLLIMLFVQVLKKYRQEKKLSQAKNDFINNLSHEIQTPVFAIQVANKLIREKSADLQVRPLTTIIEKETAQLKKHAAKILELASIENNQVALTKEKIDLNRFVEKKLPTLELMLKEKKGSIEVIYNQNPVIAELDPVHFNNILVSLADNSIKYNAQVPKIVLRIFKDKDKVGLILSDNGIGVAKEHLPFVFDKFYRVPPNGPNRAAGFGLGLNYVSEVVRLHKGNVSFTSELGKGSIVSISLPKISNDV